jgi:NTP pyrophosphatase (non-canonical NTP hydrolase)
MTTSTTAPPRDWAALAADPYGMAAELVAALRGAGFATDTEQERQVLALAEEAGELVGAVRRWMGYARRPGPFADVEAEAADLLVTTYVAAVVLDIPAEHLARARASLPPRRRRARPAEQVLALFATTGLATATWMEPDGRRPARLARVLAEILAELDLVADHLGIDLAAAVATKAEVIFTRGWRAEQ